ncbi:MAG: septal ring lytic transglycosylase RlpA family protein [Deferrisomatales bacterium]
MGRRARHLRRILWAAVFAAGAAAVPPAHARTPPAQGLDAPAIATYYARQHEGRRTASGAVHSAAGLTAAHSHLPFGTRVRVTHLGNRRSVVVTVNDRCRPRRRPFIDLSRAAARELGFLQAGVARVTIEVLE